MASTTLLKSAGPARRVLVVTRLKAHGERDAQALKRMGLVADAICSSATEALGRLTQRRIDVILCDDEIDDLDAKSFVRAVKNNQSLKNVPVVMATLVNDRNAVLDAVSSGCSGYILRPYSDETFEKHMSTALQLLRFNEIESRQLKDAKLMLELGDFDEAVEEFEEVLSLKGEAQKYYDMGCKFLAREKYGKAIVAFQKAVKINALFAEAYQGLAEAYKRKGDLEQCQFHLKRAADVYAEADRMEKVKELFVDILKIDYMAPNPFNTLGVKLRKAGDYESAVRAYNQALELTPNDENVYFNLAKAFFFMNRPKESLEHAAMSLRMNPRFAEARELYKKLKGAPWPGPLEEPAASPDPTLISSALKDV